MIRAGSRTFSIGGQLAFHDEQWRLLPGRITICAIGNPFCKYPNQGHLSPCHVSINLSSCNCRHVGIIFCEVIFFKSNRQQNCRAYIDREEVA